MILLSACRFLGNVYASQACVLLNMFSEAVHYLNLKEITEKGLADDVDDLPPLNDHLPLTQGP